MTLCILNSIVGVVVQKTVDSILQHEQSDFRTRRTQINAINELTQLMFEMDKDKSDEISMQELVAASESPSLVRILREVDFPAGFTLQDLFQLLDTDGSGILSRNEFVGGIFRLLFSNEFQRQCLARLGEAHLRQTFLAIKEELIMEIREERHSLVYEIGQLLNASQQGTCPVDKDPPLCTQVPTTTWTHRSARIQANRRVAQDYPELRRAFTPSSSQDHASARQESGLQLPLGVPAAQYHLFDTNSNSFGQSTDDSDTIPSEDDPTLHNQRIASSNEVVLPFESMKPTIPTSTQTRVQEDFQLLRPRGVQL